MYDIVERLRAHVVDMYGGKNDTMREAADEIDRLREMINFKSAIIEKLSAEEDRLGLKNVLLSEALRNLKAAHSEENKP